MKWLQLLHEYAGAIISFYVAFMVNLMRYLFESEKIIFTKWLISCIVSGMCAAAVYQAGPEWIPDNAKFLGSIVIGFIGGFKILSKIEDIFDKKIDEKTK